MAEIFPVPMKGIGKPDYTREVSAGRERAGITLKYNQQLKIFVAVFQNVVPPPSPIPWVQPPLAIGGSSSLYDASTGLTGPFTIPRGHIMTMVQKDWNFNQDVGVWLYFDGLIVANIGLCTAGQMAYINPVFAYSSTLFDPTASAAHTWDIFVTNHGGAIMQGGITVAAIQELLE